MVYEYGEKDLLNFFHFLKQQPPIYFREEELQYKKSI